ncbi:hypothetical protein TRVL_03369 [Trypanosoma vivax]|nr:hypothetical protein TRVL_03369 [Trypanosoma vivax]
MAGWNGREVQTRGSATGLGAKGFEPDADTLRERADEGDLRRSDKEWRGRSWGLENNAMGQSGERNSKGDGHSLDRRATGQGARVGKIGEPTGLRTENPFLCTR